MSEAELATLDTLQTHPSTLDSVDEEYSDTSTLRSHVVVSDLGSISSCSVDYDYEHHSRSSSESSKVVSEMSSPDSPLSEEDQALLDACQEGNLEKVRDLVESGQQLDLNKGALHYAAGNNFYQVCRYLLDKGADPNARLEPLGATPALWACRNGHAYIVHLLLDNKAEASICDGFGCTMLHLAVQSSNILMVVYVAHLGVAVDAMDTGGRTALHWAVAQGDHLSVESLLKAGASPNLVDGDGNSALMLAVDLGKCSDVVSLLLRYGADPVAYRAKQTGDLPRVWTDGCKAVGRDSNDVLRRSRLFSPEFVKAFTSVLPLMLLTVALSLPRVCGNLFIGILLEVTLVYIAKTQIERLLPLAWPHSKPLVHSTLLAGAFSAVFILNIAYFVMFIAPYTFQAAPLTAGLLSVLISLICLFYITAVFMDPGVIMLKSTAQSLRDMNSLLERGLFDSIHFCVHTYQEIPARASYDHYLERIVCRYDHYCPWIYNAVGIRNHRAFLAFVIFLATAIPFMTYQYFLYSFHTSFTSFGVQLCIVTLIQCVWICVLLVVQMFQMTHGATTYELSHAAERNVHLKDPIKAFSSLPKDHHKYAEFYAMTAAQSLRRFESSAQNSQTSLNAQNAQNSQSSYAHSKGKLAFCLKLTGFQQLMILRRLSTAHVHWNDQDYGIIRNVKDFWFGGGSIFNPRGCTGSLNGAVVDYQALPNP